MILARLATVETRLATAAGEDQKVEPLSELTDGMLRNATLALSSTVDFGNGQYRKG